MTEHHVDRRAYLRATGAVAAGGAVGLAGCTSDEADDGTTDDEEDGPDTGMLSTAVTDQPGDIADFESCVVTIEGIWVKPRNVDDEDEDADDADDTDDADDADDVDDEGEDADGADGADDADDADDADTDDEEADADDEEIEDQDEEDVDQSGGRQYHEFDEPQEADLVQLQGENTQLVDERELSTAEYQFLQLDVSGVEGVLADGNDAEVDTPGNAPLQFKERFEIRAGWRTSFLADFAPVRRGQGNRYLLQPVASGIGVSYQELDGDDADAENESDGPDESDDASENGADE